MKPKRALVFAAFLSLLLGHSSRAQFAAGKKTGEILVNPTDGAEMVWVPEGEFLMGSKAEDKTAQDSETPQHRVTLSGYWMYRTEVTVGQYRKFLKETGGQMPREPEFKWKDNHPMVNVGWNDAKAYAEWAGARLPSEAEWEKAARGDDGRAYPWGRGFSPNFCWSADASGGDNHKIGTAPVGSFPLGESPYGCLDMAGNVWEWCEDYFGAEYYDVSARLDPKGPRYATDHVFRGGAWFAPMDMVRCAVRGHRPPEFANDSLGFRCAASPMKRKVAASESQTPGTPAPTTTAPVTNGTAN